MPPTESLKSAEAQKGTPGWNAFCGRNPVDLHSDPHGTFVRSARFTSFHTFRVFSNTHETRSIHQSRTLATPNRVRTPSHYETQIERRLNYFDETRGLGCSKEAIPRRATARPPSRCTSSKGTRNSRCTSNSSKYTHSVRIQRFRHVSMPKKFRFPRQNDNSEDPGI